MSAVQEAARPLGVGEIVDRVVTMYRARPLLFLAVSAIPSAALIAAVAVVAIAFSDAFTALAPLVEGDIGGTLDTVVPALGRLAVFFALIAVVALLTSLVQSAALMAAAAARFLGREVTVGGALRAGLRATGRLFAMGAVAILAFLSMWIVLAVVATALAEWWVALLAACVALVATLYLAASWMISPAVVTLEGLGPLAALGRSWRLSERSRWRILGLVLLLVVLQAVVSSLASALLVDPIVADPGVRVGARWVLELVASIAWGPVYWGTFAVLYYDLRARAEAPR